MAEIDKPRRLVEIEAVPERVEQPLQTPHRHIARHPVAVPAARYVHLVLDDAVDLRNILNSPARSPDERARVEVTMGGALRQLNTNKNGSDDTLQSNNNHN